MSLLRPGVIKQHKPNHKAFALQKTIPEVQTVSVHYSIMAVVTWCNSNACFQNVFP